MDTVRSAMAPSFSLTSTFSDAGFGNTSKSSTRLASAWTSSILIFELLQLIVTIEEQVPELPAPSDTVNVTIFGPELAQVKVLGVKPTKFGGLVQASVLPLFICDGCMVIEFPLTNGTFKFLHLATGFVRSRTVTVALQVLLEPPGLVTVNTTVFGPKFEQLNVVLLSAKVKPAVLHKSVLPLLMPLVVTDPLPLALSTTVAFLHFATGAWLYPTVTTAEQVPTFWQLSVTLSITMF